MLIVVVVVGFKKIPTFYQTGPKAAFNALSPSLLPVLRRRPSTQTQTLSNFRSSARDQRISSHPRTLIACLVIRLDRIQNSMSEVIKSKTIGESEKEAPLPSPEKNKKLPPPPEKPEPGDCCGSGCVRCVWDVYYDELEEYDKIAKEISQSQSQSQSPADSSKD